MVNNDSRTSLSVQNAQRVKLFHLSLARPLFTFSFWNRFRAEPPFLIGAAFLKISESFESFWGKNSKSRKTKSRTFRKQCLG